MTIEEAMRARHSVRSYEEKPIADQEREELERQIAACSRESGLAIRLVTEEPEAFSSGFARYGSFRGVRNYITLAGKKGPDLQERCGYFGEKLVLTAQMLRLNTCWVALTFSKSAVRKHLALKEGEVLVAVIAVGYGTTQGVPHRSKMLEQTAAVQGPMPDWFRRGAEAALLAPTAMNQQSFRLLLKGEEPAAVSTGGFYSKIDLGIVRCHFEAAAGRRIQ